MTTTFSFQIKPDYYNSKDECIITSKEKIQTNSRYKNFNQTHFTAGDEEQFIDYKLDVNGENKDIDLKDNKFFEHNFQIWKGYHNLETTAVLNTFRYIFNKFKKGIFIKILNNELKVFLPFSNANFINEWSHKISKVDMNIFKYASENEGRIFNEKSVNDFKNTWYANNCLIRYEFPIHEGDTNVSNIKNMLDELCNKRILPDIELFLNRRDFPIITNNYCEPYYDLWDSYNHSLVSHKYEKYTPILSMSKTNNFADVLIPTHEDWARIQSKENKWFCKSYRGCDIDNSNTKWEDKISIAVFRGSSTGKGITIETNQRLKIAHLSYLKEIDNDDNLPYLDAGITKWNLRVKKLMNESELKVTDINKLPFSLIPSLTFEEQCIYKYIIHIDGHVSAFRLSSELSMNSVILLVESEWKIWYSHLLKPYVHYIPVRKDLSNIYRQIKWCKNNDDKCKQISINARKFYETYLQKDGILDYMQKIFIDIKKQTGGYTYHKIPLLTLQLQEEEYIISKIMNVYPKTDKTLIKSIPNIGRCYGLLEGIQFVINYFKDKHNLNDILLFKEHLFKNNSVEIEKYKINHFNFIMKSSLNEKKKKENIHETFVGLLCINKLLKKIPNFSYVFGINNNNKIIIEYIEGQKLFDYIKSDKFDIKEYIFILLQICLSLSVAQNEYCFVHYDLTTWNIILQRLDKEIDIDYNINNVVYSVRTKIIPIIIDYGKSHIVYNYEHHGFVNMFKFSTCQDIISLLLTSVFSIITEQNLNKNEFNDILKIINFISNSKYRDKPFYNCKDLKSFLRNAKKYSNLLYNNKYELENFNPMHLYNYLINKMKYDFPIIKKKSNFISCMDKSDGEQIFNFIFSNEDEKINSFIETINSLKLCKENNTRKCLNNIQRLNLIGNDLLSYDNNKNNKKIIKDVLKHIINNIKIDLDCDFDLNKLYIKETSYNENIFYEKDNLIKILNEYEKYDLEYMKLIFDIKIIYDEIQNCKIDLNYDLNKQILNIDTKLILIILNSIANINTLNKLYKIV